MKKHARVSQVPVTYFDHKCPKCFVVGRATKFNGEGFTKSVFICKNGVCKDYNWEVLL